MPYDITERKREWYREVSARSRIRKRAAVNGELAGVGAVINTPTLNPASLMPKVRANGLRALSLFSGGGGLDLGFERAGFGHIASYDILDICGCTLQKNRLNWRVYSGSDGDVTAVDWSQYKGVDVIHGGPPCQPFSIAGRQLGAGDERDMWPSFINAVLRLKPLAFVAENVPGLLDPKFSDYVKEVILNPLSPDYSIVKFRASAADYGVPQVRRRVFFVGFRRAESAGRFLVPEPTHFVEGDLFTGHGKRTMGVRRALGLEDIGFDCFAPTLRSGFTGPRKSTSILNSKASQAIWERLGIWPNGVQKSREAAVRFPPENGHFRLSVQDCAILQGFPEGWIFEGAAYQKLGQIGNSVCPPVAYAVARAVAKAIIG